MGVQIGKGYLFIFSPPRLLVVLHILMFYVNTLAYLLTSSKSINHIRRLRTMVSSLPSLPLVPGTDPSSCVLDAFRTAIAKRLSDRLPQLAIETAYSGVDYGKKGVDFTVALPRFRLPGKPEELANRVLEEVCLLQTLEI